MPPGTEPPDPSSEGAFTGSKLDHGLRGKGVHAVLLDYHKTLIALRKTTPALAEPDKLRLEVDSYGRERVLYLRRWKDESEVFAALNFNEQEVTIKLPIPAGKWRLRLNSADPRWNADSDLAKKAKTRTLDSAGETELTLAPHSIQLYLKTIKHDAAAR